LNESIARILRRWMATLDTPEQKRDRKRRARTKDQGRTKDQERTRN